MDYIRWWVRKNERAIGELAVPFIIVSVVIPLLLMAINIVLGAILLFISVVVWGLIAYVFISDAWKKSHEEYKRQTEK